MTLVVKRSYGDIIHIDLSKLIGMLRRQHLDESRNLTLFLILPDRRFEHFFLNNSLKPVLITIMPIILVLIQFHSKHSPTNVVAILDHGLFKGLPRFEICLKVINVARLRIRLL